MKRKLAFGLVGIMAFSALTGCGSSKSNYLLDMNYSDYVTLCEYKGVEATKVNFDVSDEEIQESIEEAMYDYATYDVIRDRGIEEGDYANIDYTATVDGEVSEDYSGEDEDIPVGEGYIYSEVEEALLGMQADESKTVEVVLSEYDAMDEEDIGKQITVEFTVNEITVENLPEYNEEFVKEKLGYDSDAAYKAALKEELMAAKEEEYKYVTVEEILYFMLDNSEFNGYPEELYKTCEEEYDNNNAYYASMYGMELEDYLDLFGMDESTREQDIKDSVNQELVIGAIAQAEGIDCTKDEVKKYVKDVYEDYGYDSEDEFLEDYSEQEVGYEIIYEKVADFLYENAKYVEISEEQYLEEQEDDWDDEEGDDALELEEDDLEEDDSEEDEAGENDDSGVDEAGEEDDNSEVDGDEDATSGNDENGDVSETSEE